MLAPATRPCPRLAPAVRAPSVRGLAARSVAPPRRRSAAPLMTREAAANMSPPTAPPPPPAERTGFAVLAAGQPLERWTFSETAPLAPTEVDIRVTHNGLCHTDIHMKNDDWDISGYPFIPGHEVVGIVAVVGANVPHACARVGQRVGVGWIKNSCRCCRSCLRGAENVCHAGYTGLIVGAHAKGGFADYLRVPADFVYSIPDALPSAAAAPLLCAGVTVYAPLARWMRPGARVAILGVGGLGHLALQFASALGSVRVTAVDIDATKAEEAARFRADEFLHLPAFMEEARASASGSGRFDVILNAASASISTAALLRALAPDGTLIQVGLPGGGAVLDVPLMSLVFGQKRVVGSLVGGRAAMRDMLELAAAKGIAPAVELAPLRDVNAQMARVAAGQARYRVVMLSDEAWAQHEAQQEALLRATTAA